MNFIIENNKFDKKWYKIEAYTIPESDEIKTKFFNEYLDMINSISSCTLYDYLEFENTYYNSSVIGDIVNDYLNGDISKEKFIRQLSAATEIYLTE